MPETIEEAKKRAEAAKKERAAHKKKPSNITGPGGQSERAWKESERFKKDPGAESRAKREAAADKGMAVHEKSPKARRVTTLKTVTVEPKKPKKRPSVEEEKKKQPLTGPGAEPLTGLGEELPAGRKKKKK